MTLKLPEGYDQLTTLLSERDRMVSIYRRNDDPIYKFGLELVATVMVCADPDGKISISLSHNPADIIKVEFVDDDTRLTHMEQEAELRALASMKNVKQ